MYDSESMNYQLSDERNPNGPNLGLFDNSRISPLGILEMPVTKSLKVANISFEPPIHTDFEFKLHFFVDCALH